MFWTLYKFVLSLYPVLKNDTSQGDQLLTTLTHLEVYLPAVLRGRVASLWKHCCYYRGSLIRKELTDFFFLIFTEQLKVKIICIQNNAMHTVTEKV